MVNSLPYIAYNIIDTIHTSYLLACMQVIKYMYRIFMCEDMLLCLEMNDRTNIFFITNFFFTKTRLFSGHESLYSHNTSMAGHGLCHSSSSHPQHFIFRNHPKPAQDLLLNRFFFGFTVNLATRWLKYLSSVLPILLPQITGAAQTTVATNIHIWILAFSRQFQWLKNQRHI